REHPYRSPRPVQQDCEIRGPTPWFAIRHRPARRATTPSDAQVRTKLHDARSPAAAHREATAPAGPSGPCHALVLPERRRNNDPISIHSREKAEIACGLGAAAAGVI